MEQETVDVIARFFVLIVSLTVHEFSHAWSAYRLGDDTAARLGRMTLNPLSHLDVLGSLMILFAPIGWAKPVPVDVLRLRNPRRSGPLVALAGPASNFLLALFCAVLLAGLSSRDGGVGWFRLLLYFIQINFALAIFNLLPLHPLDGSKVLPLILPRGAARAYGRLVEKWGPWPLMLLFLPMILGLRGPLHLWFGLWSSILRPVLRVSGLPAIW